MITPGGNYTAPAAIPGPDPKVLVTATSVADPSISAVATVTITPAPTPTVQISGPKQVALNTQYTYTATVSLDLMNQGVTWSLVCLTDSEGPPDCADIDEGTKGDNDMDAFLLAPNPSNISFTIILKTPNPTDAGEKFTLRLIATSVAAGSDGTRGIGTWDISSP
jgi:hypothetical protein